MRFPDARVALFGGPGQVGAVARGSPEIGGVADLPSVVTGDVAVVPGEPPATASKEETFVDLLHLGAPFVLRFDFDLEPGDLLCECMLEEAGHPIDAIFDGSRIVGRTGNCLLYTSPSPRDKRQSRMPSSA